MLSAVSGVGYTLTQALFLRESWFLQSSDRPDVSDVERARIWSRDR